MTRPSLNPDHLARPTASDIARWMETASSPAFPVAVDTPQIRERILRHALRRRPMGIRSLWRALRDLWLGRAVLVRVNVYTLRYFADLKRR
jgi:hypothetical protein